MLGPARRRGPAVDPFPASATVHMRGEERPDDNDEHGDGGSAHPRWQIGLSPTTSPLQPRRGRRAWRPAADANAGFRRQRRRAASAARAATTRMRSWRAEAMRSRATSAGSVGKRISPMPSPRRRVYAGRATAGRSRPGGRRAVGGGLARREAPGSCAARGLHRPRRRAAGGTVASSPMRPEPNGPRSGRPWPHCSGLLDRSNCVAVQARPPRLPSTAPDPIPLPRPLPTPVSPAGQEGGGGRGRCGGAGQA